MIIVSCFVSLVVIIGLVLSVAVMILTTEAMVTNIPEKNPPMGMPPGGMDGMGGMGGMM